MGALHAGHLALLEAARRRCDVVVMSLFVNPRQFGPGEDLDALSARRGPRPRARPSTRESTSSTRRRSSEVYPEGFATPVASRRRLTEVLDGDPARRGSRPLPRRDHGRRQALQRRRSRRRVLRPKDAQQAVVIRQMVRDLDFPVEIEVVPTVREPDGLAMSSRNAYLDAGERERAAALSRGLAAAETAARAGATMDEALRAAARRARGRRDRSRVPGGARRRRPDSGAELQRPARPGRPRRAGRCRAADRQRGDRVRRRRGAREP